MMVKRTTYSVHYECRNCGWSGRIQFDTGQKAYEKQTCPNCDCFAAEKALNPKPVMPMPQPAPRREPIEPDYPYIPWPTPFPRKDPWEDPRPWRRNVPYYFMIREEEDRRKRLRNYRVD